ncbi:MAG TPA: amidohydrolase family protein [Vicinamibacterales bacterium]|nr:amidohydrolase family protein [Vicinamibacterales bacterium]
MLSSIRADWVLPIAGPPLQGGSVTIEDGRIVAVEPTAPPGAINLGRRVLMPGLVNAHTHLELSYLRGRIPRAARFTDWVRPLLAARQTPPDPAEVEACATEAVGEAVESGTVLFGDVSNALGVLSALRESRMAARVFYELLGFNSSQPDAHVAEARVRVDAEQRAAADDGLEIRFSVAPHAPYSVSPALFDAIGRDTRAHGSPTTVHLAEGQEEVQLLADGTGPWRALLETLGVWSDAWQPPAASPVAYLQQRGFLNAATLIVHGVQCTGADIARVRDIGATLVSCPRSNAYVGAGEPPLADFYAAGVPVAFGTDSLASVADLNLFSELAEARRLAPEVPARRLLESATLIGARALGFERDYGSLEPGKRAALVSVGVPGGVTDVEEYLLSGLTTEMRCEMPFPPPQA